MERFFNLKKMAGIATGLATVVLTVACSTVPSGDKTGWYQLFNGKDLSGWVQKNGTAEFKVDNGEIVGT
ncbi:MAG TPA: hypothetical protein PLC81_09785, partial [Bacteroidales bacterium]|nr:hypothetical protein [Bacteroidales bacterium]